MATQADTLAASLDLRCVIALARRASSPDERRHMLERWRYVGPHRSAEFRLSSEDVDFILDRLASSVVLLRTSADVAGERDGPG
jgi:hypothetical protein